MELYRIGQALTVRILYGTTKAGNSTSPFENLERAMQCKAWVKFAMFFSGIASFFAAGALLIRGIDGGNYTAPVHPAFFLIVTGFHLTATCVIVDRYLQPGVPLSVSPERCELEPYVVYRCVDVLTGEGGKRYYLVHKIKFEDDVACEYPLQIYALPNRIVRFEMDSDPLFQKDDRFKITESVGEYSVRRVAAGSIIA